MQRKGSAIWNGDLKSGKGTVSTESGAVKEQQLVQQQAQHTLLLQVKIPLNMQ